MSCDQLPVLYQNRHCYQEDIDEIVFKNNYLSYNGFDDFSLFKIKKFSSSKRNSTQFKPGSNTFVKPCSIFEDALYKVYW